MTSPGLQAGNPESQQRATNAVLGAGFAGLGIFDTWNRLVFSEPAAIRPAFADIDAVGIAPILGGQGVHVSILVTAGDAKAVPRVDSGHGRRKGCFRAERGIARASSQAFRRVGATEGRRTGLRDAWSAGVGDRKGSIVARSQRPETFVGHLAQAPMVQASAGAATSGPFDLVSRDGIDIKNAFQRVPEIGWTVGVAVPAAVANASQWKPP